MIALDCERRLAASVPAHSINDEKMKIVFRPEDVSLGQPTGLVETPYHLGRGEVLEVTFTGASETLLIKLLPSRRPGDTGSDCNMVIKVLRNKWDARRLMLKQGDKVSVGLKSYKILEG